MFNFLRLWNLVRFSSLMQNRVLWGWTIEPCWELSFHHYGVGSSPLVDYEIMALSHSVSEWPKYPRKLNLVVSKYIIMFPGIHNENISLATNTFHRHYHCTKNTKWVWGRGNSITAISSQYAHLCKTYFAPFFDNGLCIILLYVDPSSTSIPKCLCRHFVSGMSEIVIAGSNIVLQASIQ